MSVAPEADGGSKPVWPTLESDVQYRPALTTPQKFVETMGLPDDKHAKFFCLTSNDSRTWQEGLWNCCVSDSLLEVDKFPFKIITGFTWRVNHAMQRIMLATSWLPELLMCQSFKLKDCQGYRCSKRKISFF
jgi:hypothetical protein